ncbi:MAG TPA: hypothetical protein PKN80_09355, partial [bacterium]|nr:hypothetical protein [bacterium]
MRINILATLGRRPGGAHRNFLEYADRLTGRGHRVTVIKAINRAGTRPAGFAARGREWIFLHTGAPRRPYRVAWLKCSAEIVAVPSYREEYLPAADATLFSSTRLIETVAGFSERNGAKLMRVADIFFARQPPEVPAEIQLVATSSLVRNLLLKRFPERKIPLLLNGVNLELFRNPDRRFRPARRIGFLFYQKRPAHKGLDDAVAALEKLRSEFPGLEFACAGFRRESWLPGWIEFFAGQDQAALARFYSD